nr:hypothetical protein [Deltaproteobacteria bacterium]
IATHAEPGDKVIFLMSAGEVTPGPCPDALGGTCLDLERPYVIGRVVADEKGAAVLEAVLPPQTETGSSISFEAVVSRGEDGAETEKSNPVQVVITR